MADASEKEPLRKTDDPTPTSPSDEPTVEMTPVRRVHSGVKRTDLRHGVPHATVPRPPSLTKLTTAARGESPRRRSDVTSGDGRSSDVYRSIIKPATEAEDFGRSGSQSDYNSTVEGSARHIHIADAIEIDKSDASARKKTADEEKLGELLEKQKRDFSQHSVTMTFVDPEVEDEYCNFQYVESGFVGGKLYAFLALGLMVIAFLAFHPGGPKGSMFTNQWYIPMLIAIFFNAVLFVTLFIPQLYWLREVAFLGIIMTHWPAWTMVTLMGKSPQAYNYPYLLGCYYFCTFIAQARFARIFIFLSLSPLLTLIGVCFGVSTYFQSRSYLEILNWPLLFFPLVTLQIFERQSRKAFVQMTKSAMAIELLEHKIVVTQRMVARFFPPTPTLDLLQEADGPRHKTYPLTVMVVTDIAGFTAWTSKTAPDKVITTLSDMFVAIDNVCPMFNMEKVSTVGDCFFGAIFPGHTPDLTLIARCTDCVKFSLAIINLARGLTMRIGCHMGEVVGGFVGFAPPKFDLFGQDVDIAKKMEQMGTPGRVHVSDAMLKACGTTVDIGSPERTDMGVTCNDWQEADTAGSGIFVHPPDDCIPEIVIEREAPKICNVLCSIGNDFRGETSGAPGAAAGLSASFSRSGFRSGDNQVTSGAEDFEVDLDDNAEDDYFKFHWLTLSFEQESVEKRFAIHHRHGGLGQAINTIFVLLAMVLFGIHLCLGCVDDVRDRLVTLAIAMILTVHIGYLIYIGCSHRLNMVVLQLTYGSISVLASLGFTTNCEGTARAFYVGQNIFYFQMLWALIPQFQLEVKLVWRCAILTITVATHCLLVLLRRVIVKDEALVWDLVFLVELVAFSVVSFFADFSLRSAFVSHMKLKRALKSSKGRHAEEAARAMDIMLPTFVSEELMGKKKRGESDTGSARDDDTTAAAGDLRSEATGASDGQSSSTFEMTGGGSEEVLWEYDCVTAMFIHFDPPGAEAEDYMTVNRTITAIEQIVKANNIQKVKTMGTTMLCLDGISDDTTPEQATLKVVKTARAVMANVFGTGLCDTWEYSIGINSGPCFGAVIGERGLQFDVFGDTINTASRMYSTAPKHTIQMSMASRIRIPDLDRQPFVIERLPDVKVKGKGTMEVYTILDKKKKLKKQDLGLLNTSSKPLSGSGGEPEGIPVSSEPSFDLPGMLTAAAKSA